MSDKMSPVGLIGVGTMGREILHLLIKSGRQVIAYDPLPEVNQIIHDLGGVPAEDIEQVARECEMALLVLPGPHQVREVTNQITSEPKSLVRIVCDLTTSTPQVTQEIGSELSDMGISFIDTPILGRPSAAGRGEAERRAGPTR